MVRACVWFLAKYESFSPISFRVASPTRRYSANEPAMKNMENTSRESTTNSWYKQNSNHDDVIKWNHFPHYWPFVWGIHRSPVNSPHKGQWRGALIVSLIRSCLNGWVNNGEDGERRHRDLYDVTVMIVCIFQAIYSSIIHGFHCHYQFWALQIFVFIIDAAIV